MGREPPEDGIAALPQPGEIGLGLAFRQARCNGPEERNTRGKLERVSRSAHQTVSGCAFAFSSLPPSQKLKRSNATSCSVPAKREQGLPGAPRKRGGEADDTPDFAAHDHGAFESVGALREVERRLARIHRLLHCGPVVGAAIADCTVRFHARPIFRYTEKNGTKLFARQLNCEPEPAGEGFVSDDALAGALGFKSEWGNTIGVTKNGGRTEVFGGLLLPAQGFKNPDAPAFIIEDAQFFRFME